jgi:hypothetical protein
MDLDLLGSMTRDRIVAGARVMRHRRIPVIQQLALVRPGRNLARGRLDEAAAHLAVVETHADTAPPDP